MPAWEDRAIVLGQRPLGEGKAIVQLLSEAHGRMAGMVHGAEGRRQRPLLEPGTLVLARWRARLEDQLGTLTLEPGSETAPPLALIEDPAALDALQAALALLSLLTPERAPAPILFAALAALLPALPDPAWPLAYVAFELALLEELGHPLDLSRCAATGMEDDLTHVSPKSGRAVSRAAAQGWEDRLLPLPGFLTRAANRPPAASDFAQALTLTGFFVERRLLADAGHAVPHPRLRLADRLARRGIG